MQLGWVEEIGTGIYNVNRYLPFYLPGGKASYKEDVIFTATIPIPNQDEPEKTEMKGTTLKEDLHDVIRDRAAIHDIVRSTNHVTHHDTYYETLHDTPEVIKFYEKGTGETITILPFLKATTWRKL